jgi:hypothetical protein
MRRMWPPEAKVPVVGQYNAKGVVEPELRAMSAANGRSFEFMQDTEAEIPQAPATISRA